MRHVFACLLCLTLTPLAFAQERLPDRRAAAGAPAGTAPTAVDGLRENMLDLMRQLEEVQVELRSLRNSVELQGNELTQLKTRQREALEDLDRRLRDLERRAGGAAPAVAAPPAPAVAAAPAASAPAAPTAPAKPAAAAKPEPAKPAAAPAPAATGQNEQAEYDAAFALMRQGYYDRAVRAFRDFIAHHPNAPLTDNAQYWIAEGNYVLRNYKLALEEFSKVIAQYPGSAKVPDAMLKLGYTHYELGAHDKARAVLGDVITRYPGTTVAKLASARLDKMKKEGK
jgi:tol-pal system protein YbgF